MRLTSLRSRYRRLRTAIPVTRLGIAVTVFGVAAWVVASRTGWREANLIAAGALLLVILGVPFLFRRGSFTSALTVGPSDRVKVGTPCLGGVIVTNTGTVRSLPQQVELELGTMFARFDVPSIGLGDSCDELPFQVPTDRRGVLNVGPVTMVRGDPVGLFRRNTAYTDSIRVYVHPRHVRGPGLSTGFLRDVDGPTFDNSPRGDVAFHTIREYVRGDDRRHIHWRSTARAGKTMVRQYVDNRRPELVIGIDDFASAYATEDEFERAMEIVASAEVSCFAAGQTVTHHRSAGRVGARTLNDLLDDLAAADVVDRELMLPTVGRMMAIDGGATVGMIVTGSAARAAVVQRCAQHVERSMRSIVVRVVPGRVSLRESANGIVMQVDSLKDFARLWKGVCSR